MEAIVCYVNYGTSSFFLLINFTIIKQFNDHQIINIVLEIKSSNNRIHCKANIINQSKLDNNP